MRCYFLSGGHIAAVEELTGLSDDQAVAKAYQLFAERVAFYEGFEVWDRARIVVRSVRGESVTEGSEAGAYEVSKAMPAQAAPRPLRGP